MADKGPHLIATIVKSERLQAENGSRYRKVAALVEGHDKTLMVWDTKLFDPIDDAAEKQETIEVVLGSTEKTSNYIQKVLGPVEAPAPQAAAAGQPEPGGGKFWKPLPWNPEDRAYDLRKAALNNATVLSVELLRAGEFASLKETASEVVTTAGSFEAYLRGDPPPSTAGGASKAPTATAEAEPAPSAKAAPTDPPVSDDTAAGRLRELRALAARLGWKDKDLQEWWAKLPAGEARVRFQDSSEDIQRGTLELLRQKVAEADSEAADDAAPGGSA